MLRESFIYIASKALPNAIAFVTGVSLTWLLTPADYGVYGLGSALVSLLSTALFAWHALSFMRYYQSGGDNPKFMPTILQSFLLLCLVSGLGALALGASGMLSREYQVLIWICVPGTWCFSWFELAARMQVARFRPMRYLWMNLARNAGILVCCLAIAWATHAPLYVLAGSFVAMLGASVAFGSGGFSLRPQLFDRGIATRLLAFGWPLAIVQLIGGSSFAIDRILLEHFSGKAEVGFYTVAYALAQTTISTIAAGIDSAIYSRAVRAVDRKDPAALQQQLARNCAMLLALMVPAAVGAAMVAPALARLVVDPAYVEPVTGLMAWMAIAALIIGFRAYYVDHAFHFGHSTLPLTVVIGVMTAVNVAADLVLIPRWGALGCAMASIVAGTVGLIHGTIAARAVMPLPFPPKDFAKIAAASAAMALFLWPLHRETGFIALAIQVIGGLGVYGAAVLALDLMHLRQHVRGALAGFRPRR